MTGPDAPDPGGHIGPEHRWAQAALDRETARAADPDRALARLLAEKIAAAQTAEPLPPASAAAVGRGRAAAAAWGAPAGPHIADPATEAEEPARWTTDRW